VRARELEDALAVGLEGGGLFTAIFQRPLISPGSSFEVGSRSFTVFASRANLSSAFACGSWPASSRR
jgi:hypothetical protein